MSRSLAIPTSADTYVHDAQPAGNCGAATALAIKTGPATTNRRSVLKFPLGTVDPARIAGAWLRINGLDTNGGPAAMGIFGTTDGWTETGITWSNQPALGTRLGTATLAPQASWHQIDVTAFVRAEAAGDDTASFALSGDTTDYLSVASKEAGAATTPTLTLTLVQPQQVAVTADAYTFDGAPGQNHGTGTTLAVKTTPASTALTRRTYLKFPLNRIDPDTVTSARLRVHGNSATGATGPMTIFGTADSWTETTIVFTNQPATATQLADVSVGTTPQWHDIDVTAYIRGQAAGDDTASFAFVGQSTEFLQFASREAGTANTPTLHIQSTASSPGQVVPAMP